MARYSLFLMIGLLLPWMANANLPRPEDQFTQVTIVDIQAENAYNVAILDKTIASDEGVLIAEIDGKTERIPFYMYFHTGPSGVTGAMMGQPTTKIQLGTGPEIDKLKGQKALLLTMHYAPLSH